MKVALAALADAANVSQRGKLNILGQFDTIYANSFPCLHPSMTLAFRILTESEDTGREFEIDVSLIDQDAQKLWAALGQAKVGHVKPGRFGHTNQIVDLKGITFKKPGRYRFRIKIEGQEQPTDVVFQVIQAEAPAS